MRPHDEQLDRLISLRLDGEITPADDGLLERRLTEEPEARARLAVLTRLHAACDDLIRGQLLGGLAPRAVLATARRRATETPAPPALGERFLRSRLASGLAACLLLGTLLLSLFDRPPLSQPDPVADTLVAPNTVDPRLNVFEAPTIPVGSPAPTQLDPFGRPLIIEGVPLPEAEANDL